MIQIGNTVISEEILDTHFVCDLKKCKGACCIEGDLGAPLTEDELLILEDEYENIAPYLSEQGREEIEQQGLYVLDEDGDFSTPTISGKECVYAVWDDNGTLGCGIEKAYREGNTPFIKPISCHLYPIRITQTKEFVFLNYHKWEICDAACSLGQSLKLTLYKFLREPLERVFGKAWYQELTKWAQESRM